MMYQDYLAEMLRPLGIYDSEGMFQLGELVAEGVALDEVSDIFDEVEREMCLWTAEDWGVNQISDLFILRPQSITEQQRKEALMALLRISGDSFTLDTLNQTLAGCGVSAKVSETEEVGRVEITFPDLLGYPPAYEIICSIIETILPAHLNAGYEIRYFTWFMLEEKGFTFGEISALQLDWLGLETYME